MKRIFFIAFLLSLILVMGCATTHYVAPVCPTMEQPPNFNNLDWVKISIINPDTGKEVSYYAIPASEVIKEKLNIERAKEYIMRAFELNKPE